MQVMRTDISKFKCRYGVKSRWNIICGKLGDLCPIAHPDSTRSPAECPLRRKPIWRLGEADDDMAGIFGDF